MRPLDKHFLHCVSDESIDKLCMASVLLQRIVLASIYYINGDLSWEGGGGGVGRVGSRVGMWMGGGGMCGRGRGGGGGGGRRGVIDMGDVFLA